MAAEKRARNAEIVKARLEGKTLREIAKDFGLAICRVFRIINTWEKKHPLDVEDQRRQAIRELTDLANTLWPGVESGSMKASQVLCKVLTERARIAGVPTTLDIKPLSWLTPNALMKSIQDQANAADTPAVVPSSLPESQLGKTSPTDR